MHKEWPMGLFSDQLFDITFQNTQLHQTDDHDPHHFFRDLTDAGTGAEQRQRFIDSRQNDVINRPLSGGKFAIYRESASDITGIATVFTTRVDKDQIPVPQLTLILGIVQNAAVSPPPTMVLYAG